MGEAPVFEAGAAGSAAVAGAVRSRLAIRPASTTLNRTLIAVIT